MPLAEGSCQGMCQPTLANAGIMVTRDPERKYSILLCLVISSSQRLKLGCDLPEVKSHLSSPSWSCKRQAQTPNSCQGEHEQSRDLCMGEKYEQRDKEEHLHVLEGRSCELSSVPCTA